MLQIFAQNEWKSSRQNSKKNQQKIGKREVLKNLSVTMHARHVFKAFEIPKQILQLQTIFIEYCWKICLRILLSNA